MLDSKSTHYEHNCMPNSCKRQPHIPTLPLNQNNGHRKLIGSLPPPPQPCPCIYVHEGEAALDISHLGRCIGESYSGPLDSLLR